MFHRNVLLLFGVFIIAHFFALVNMASYQKYAFAFYAKGRNCVTLLNYPFTNAKKCDILNNGGSSDRCLIRLFYLQNNSLNEQGLGGVCYLLVRLKIYLAIFAQKFLKGVWGNFSKEVPPQSSL